ncbi:PIN domain-containing protein [Rubritalea tangerina]|uniref:PIN domain-containing protein n=1 Tax=Rubritalea tangerina TaxID=430798 RepID=A0ABW4Z9V3_9BACT
MKTNYVFIDYENVQPSGVAAIKEHNFKVFIFIGKGQKSVSAELVANLQPLGEDVVYIPLDVAGPNALDFILTFYLGKTYTSEPDAYFHIISKDKGFDTLIEHLRKQGIKVARHEAIQSIHPLKITVQKEIQEKVDLVIENLKKKGNSRPRKLSTLENTIRSLFTPHLTSKETQSIITKLINKKVLVENDGKISYHLNNPQ